MKKYKVTMIYYDGEEIIEANSEDEAGEKAYQQRLYCDEIYVEEIEDEE